MEINGIKYKNPPLYLQPKKHAEVKDPPRYPKVINGYENVAKKIFHKGLEYMYSDMVVTMVDIISKK